MRTLVLGDVHGCITELQEMLKLIDVQPEDHLISLGDLIHKGPDSHAVLKVLMELKNRVRVTVLTGNHEERQVRFCRRPTDTTRIELQEGYSEEEINFMLDSQLSIRTEGFLLLHGGISADAVVTELTLKELLKLSNRDQTKRNRVLYTRFLSKEGKTKDINHLDPECYFWAERYSGSEGEIIFGHHPFLAGEIVAFPHATGIDLGCVTGNLLCCVEIKNQEIVNEYYIPAHQRYYSYEEQ